MKPNKTKIFIKLAIAYIESIVLILALIIAGIAATASAIINQADIDRETHFIGGPIFIILGLLIFWRMIWRNYKKEYFAQLWSNNKVKE